MRSFADLRLPLARPGMRIGLFGGSFDPPHEGHLHASRMAADRLRLDRVWWIVSPGNPLKDWAPRPFAERVAAAQLLARDPRIRITDIEERLGSPYSFETIRYLQARLPGVRFVWIVGSDVFASFHLWRNWREIAFSLPIAVVERPGSILAAAASPVARLLRRDRLPDAEAARLPDCRPPAYVFLRGPRDAHSSSALRAARAIIRS